MKVSAQPLNEYIGLPEGSQTRFLNLTPHTISVWTSDGGWIDLPKSSNPLRIATSSESRGTFDGVQLSCTKFDEQDVSRVINLLLAFSYRHCVFVLPTKVIDAIANSNHKDKTLALQFCVSPDTSPDSVVRDDDGKIIGVRRFNTYSSQFK